MRGGRTPIFVMGAYALYHLREWGDPSFWSAFGIGLLVAVPIFAKVRVIYRGPAVRSAVYHDSTLYEWIPASY